MRKMLDAVSDFLFKLCLGLFLLVLLLGELAPALVLIAVVVWFLWSRG